MNILISIVFVLLSQELFGSEPQHMKRSNSTDTVDETFYGTVDLPIAEHHTLKLGERKYLKLKLARVQGQYLESANQVRDLKKEINTLTTQLAASQQDTQRIRTERNASQNDNATLRSQVSNLTAQIAQQQNRITDYENEEFTDLSCSIVGPRFRVWPCCKSQPLPKYIKVRKFRRENLSSEYYQLFYYDTRTNQNIIVLEPWCCCYACAQALLCIKPNLPDNIEIRPSIKYPERNAYFDKYNNTELVQVRYSTGFECLIYCYNGCKETNQRNNINS